MNFILLNHLKCPYLSFGPNSIKSTQFGQNWVLFFQKRYIDAWEIRQKIGIEIVRFSRSGRHIHIRFWWKYPPGQPPLTVPSGFDGLPYLRVVRGYPGFFFHQNDRKGCKRDSAFRFGLSRSGRHIHIRFWWKYPPPGNHPLRYPRALMAYPTSVLLGGTPDFFFHQNDRKGCKRDSAYT